MELLTKGMLELARLGSQKMYNSLKKFFKDSQILNEIYELIDKNVFLAAANEEKYQYVEDIKEDDIFDQFIELCVSNASLDINIKEFVNIHYSDKTDEAKEYIVSFYTNIASTIYHVLKQNSSVEVKIILKGQEINAQKIIKKLDALFESYNKRNVVIVTYSANMQGNQWNVKRDAFNRVDLSMQNFPLHPDCKDVYWEVSKKSLVEQFNKRLQAYLDDGYTIDLYALAPIPLLVLLGNLFANRPNINIFQPKKNPSTFEWDKNGDKLNITVSNCMSIITSTDVALILSFSGIVDRANVIKVVGNDIPLVEMTIAEPFDDFLRTKDQLDEFIIEYRKIKSSLTSQGVIRIHLFAAIPVAFAIGIGQAYNPNYDPEIITYDFCKGIYTKALTIGEKNGFT